VVASPAPYAVVLSARIVMLTFNLRPDIMLVGIVSLALLDKLSDTLLRVVERHSFGRSNGNEKS